MKTFPILALVCASALLSGCESGFSDDVHSVLGPREAPKSRVFQADQKATYAAVKAAADSMGYRFVRGGPAEGELEALSGITGGDEPRSSHQVSMKVHLSPNGDSGTVVEVSLTEMIEDQTPGEPAMATQTPLRDTPLYEVFFRDVQSGLAATPAH
jgi:hypothetical protein